MMKENKAMARNYKS